MLQNLRIAGVVVRVDEEDFRFLVFRGAVVDCLVVVAFYADTIGVVCIFGYFIDVVVVLGVFSRNPFKTVLEIIIVGDAFADQALLLRDLWIFTFQRAYLS